MKSTEGIEYLSYEKQKNTMLMLKIVARGEKDIKNGSLIDQDDLFKKNG